MEMNGERKNGRTEEGMPNPGAGKGSADWLVYWVQG